MKRLINIYAFMCLVYMLPVMADSSVFDNYMVAGNTAVSKADYNAAVKYYSQALEEARKTNPRNIASAVGSLGSAYSKQGKYTEAKPLLKLALELDEKTLGLNHPTTVAVKENYEKIKFLETKPIPILNSNNVWFYVYIIGGTFIVLSILRRLGLKF